jgi:mannose-6-phosphate isomerase-like protein (cupin superfamily)
VDIATQEDIGTDHPASVAQRRVGRERPTEHVDAVAVLAGDELGRELHTTADETLVVVTGRGIVELEGVSTPVRPGSVVFIPTGTTHNIRNEGSTPLRLFALHASSS